jgi:asparagine synthase (glutamine-hydrolysing)
MCGIAAIVALSPKRSPIAPKKQQSQSKKLRAMLASFAHRGDPECFGEMHVERDFALGTNRLAIVDRGQAQQPMADIGENVYVAFNGEIYNFEALREELISKGREFKTHSDTEVIANGYLEWGVDLLNKLDGIFGFVVVDHANQSFLAARDHIGIKPLYFAEADGVFYFASEQKALLEMADKITTLSIGCYVQDGKVERYYDLDKARPAVLTASSEQELIAEFKRLLSEAVRKQVQTDLPLAVMFSAGIDSSLMLHLARQYHSNVTAFTIGLDGATDIPFAEQYCSEQGIPHHVYKLDRDELVKMLPTIATGAEFFEGIDAMDACVAYFGYRLAREKGFKVSLCGEGSDEVLAGYDLFRTHPDPEALKCYRVHNLHRTDLQRVDRASMLNSVEARVPFLDKEFLEFAYHLPMSLKMRNGVEKWILREAFRGDLPDYLIDRPKVRMPEGSGVKNILMDFAATQEAKLSQEIKTALSLETPQSEYFLSLYLNAGFPIPKERQRFAGLDYSEHGYFNFADTSGEGVELCPC